MLLNEIAQRVERIRGAAKVPAIVRCSAVHLKAMLAEENASQVLETTPGGYRVMGAPVIVEPRVQISIERGQHVASLPD